VNRNEAMQCALGYAWGREDQGGTTSPADGKTATGSVPSLDFADAYATAQDEYNNQQRWFMTNVRSAWERWNVTGGKSIFGDGDDTASQMARAEAARKRSWGSADDAELSRIESSACDR
jgi:hypothetical protein